MEHSEPKKRTKKVAKNPGGRPRKGAGSRKDLWEAREAARMVLRAWEDGGNSFEGSEGQPVLLTKDKAVLLARLRSPQPTQLETWFPLMVVKDEGEADQWDLSILHAILGWDDPVVMAELLVACDGRQWLDVLTKMESSVYSRSEENAVSGAFGALVQTFPTRIDDPRLRAHVLFRENEEQRVKIHKL
jgi:hypothetical protein